MISNCHSCASRNPSISKRARLVRFFQNISLPGWLTSVAFRLICLAIAAGFGFLYVAKTASTSANGYKINTLEKETIALEKEIDELQVRLADYSSMQNIQSRLAQSNMAPVTELSFYSSVGKIVAKR
ncbi:hypothetical protein EPN28_01115 [Patescibacteria group bacterium]|nr:MAG: hypothetical protein EPN28_01115 [Patescibacteria group bacterium]